MSFGFLLAQASSVAGDADLNLLGDDLLAWLTLAFGAALAIGTGLALVRPRVDESGTPLPRPPLARSLVMIVVGAVAAVWGLASIFSGTGP